MPLPANCPSIAVMDVAENIRAKIYAVLGKLGKKLFLRLTRAVLLSVTTHPFCFGVHFSNMNKCPFTWICACSVVTPKSRLHC
jgi:hypothetical protein